MSKSAWEVAVENVLIELLRTHKMLKGKGFFHHDEVGEAETNCIVVKATQGSRQLEGPKAYEGEVECLWRSSTASPDENNDVIQAMTETISPPAGTTVQAAASTSLFSYFRIEDEKASGDRSDTASMRKRMKTFPVVALLK